MATIQFLYDFGSPNAYLAHRVIPGLEEREQVRFDYVPILLGGVFKATGNRPPLMAFADVPAKLAYERREMERFVSWHAIAAFRFNPHFPVNTLQIMRGAVAAEELGVAARYVETVFRAMWEAGEKMDDCAVIGRILAEAGLPADDLLALGERADVKRRLADNTARAVEQGVFGSPSFLVGGELYFGKDRLRDVVEAAGS